MADIANENREVMIMLKIYRCNVCGNLVEVIDDSGVVPVCCGESMERLVPGAGDGAKEKHIPVCVELTQKPEAFNDPAYARVINVQVGEVSHPMTEEHSIQWIALCTNKGVYRKAPASSDKAEVQFLLQKGEKVRAIYSYCNLHGLWVREIK